MDIGGRREAIGRGARMRAARNWKMRSGGTLAAGLAVLAAAVLLTGDVIAAPPVIDQPEAAAAETAPATRPAEVTSPDAPDASAAPDEEAGTTASRPAGQPWVTALLAAFAVAAITILIRRGWLQFSRELDPGRPGLPASSAIVLAFVMYIIHGFAAQLAQITLQPPPGGREEVFTMMAGGFAGYFAVAAVYFYLRQLDVKAGREAPGRPFVDSAAGVFAFFLWLPLVQVAAICVTVLILLVGREAPAPVAHQLLVMLASEPPDIWFWAIIISVCTLTPLFEELLYRGLVQDGLVRLGLPRWWAIGGASLVFALIHAPVVSLPALVSLFVLGLGLGWVYERTGGRLAAPVAMHAMFNLANLVITFSAFRGG